MSGVSRAVTTTQVIIIAVVVVAIGGIYFLTRGDSTSPVAVLRTNSTEIVRAGALVQFSAGDSTDNVGIVSYAWDFGDGTIGTGEDTVHAYSEAGDFTVTLTVADKAGNEESDTTMIEARLIDYWPTTGWRTSTPEEQGMDSELLAEAIDRAVGADPGGSRPHPQRDEPHTVLPPAGGDEAKAGGRYGDDPEDAEGGLLDAQKRRALPPRAGRGGSGGWTPGGLTLKQM